MTTERFFGHLLSSLYTREQPRLRERSELVSKLFDYVKHNVAKAVSVSDAYDYSSRRAAMDKLKNMTLQVGTPDFLLDPKYLKLMYKDLLVQKTDFFQNIQYGLMFLRKREELRLVSPSEESRWLDLLLDWRRAGYSPSSNRVVVPESLLRPPLFHPGYPNSVNLGGLGVRLAEAVIGGVAGHGLLYDAQGVLRVHGTSPQQHLSENGTSSSPSSSSVARPVAAFEDGARCLAARLAALGVDTPDFLRRCRRRAAVSVSALRQTLATLSDMLDVEKGRLLPALEDRDPQAIFLLAHAQSLCESKTFRRRDADRASGQELLGRERLAAEVATTPHFGHYYFCSSSSSSEEGEERDEAEGGESGACKSIM